MRIEFAPLLRMNYSTFQVKLMVPRQALAPTHSVYGFVNVSLAARSRALFFPLGHCESRSEGEELSRLTVVAVVTIHVSGKEASTMDCTLLYFFFVLILFH